MVKHISRWPPNSTSRPGADRVAAVLREISYRSRQALVATKQALGLSRRGDKTFFVDQFSRLLRSGIIGPHCKITTQRRTDGAGAQAQAMMSAIAFAHAHDVDYVHRPFTSIEHAEMEMPAWVQQWEDYFNLGAGAASLTPDGASVVALDHLAFMPRQEPAIAAAEHYLHYCNQDKDAWERVLPALRSRFWQNKKRQKPSGELRLAVHMRRGDVSADDKKVARNFTPNAIFVNTLMQLKSLLADKPTALRIEIFSQGDASMFADLVKLGAELRLNEPAIDTHRALIEADILVMSKGAFSYTAGVLNEGITLYEPQKYRPLQSWVVRAPDGSFGEALLAPRLDAMLGRR